MIFVIYCVSKQNEFDVQAANTLSVLINLPCVLGSKF